ncbi:DUF3990 domain-containing protein [Bradyrhizobium sp. HKCCYLS2038]|uniref:DUF3990 domain-containing protein n=1 Tax=Bradyrhizobium sp. HKCCYLS2038 TaxID=3420764 RepID=UPI003EBA075F
MCRPFTDFGQGFYVTTNLHQAKQWANTRVISRPNPGLVAIVMQFQLRRDWLASLESLSFIRPASDFWDLVADCRIGFPPHQRMSARRAYDMVSGPVTLWPQLLTIQDCDQISFHTTAAISALPQPLLYERADDHGSSRTLF